MSNAGPEFPSTSKSNFHIPFIDAVPNVFAVPTKVAPEYNSSTPVSVQFSGVAFKALTKAVLKSSLYTLNNELAH